MGMKLNLVFCVELDDNYSSSDVDCIVNEMEYSMDHPQIVNTEMIDISYPELTDDLTDKVWHVDKYVDKYAIIVSGNREFLMNAVAIANLSYMDVKVTEVNSDYAESSDDEEYVEYHVEGPKEDVHLWDDMILDIARAIGMEEFYGGSWEVDKTIVGEADELHGQSKEVRS